MAFDPHLFGDASATSGLSEEDIRRVVVRAERRAKYARPAAGVTEMRQRAAYQAALAAQINEALQSRDVVSARALIAEGEQLFGRGAMLDAVEVRAREARTVALEAAGGPNHDDAWEGWPE
jgi:hypothetical protein